MTVAELIHELHKFPDDCDVCILGVPVTAVAWEGWSAKAGWDFVNIVVSATPVRIEKLPDHDTR